MDSGVLDLATLVVVQENQISKLREISNRVDSIRDSLVIDRSRVELLKSEPLNKAVDVELGLVERMTKNSETIDLKLSDLEFMINTLGRIFYNSPVENTRSGLQAG